MLLTRKSLVANHLRQSRVQHRRRLVTRCTRANMAQEWESNLIRDTKSIQEVNALLLIIQEPSRWSQQRRVRVQDRYSGALAAGLRS
jgi:hypothetical protein